MSKKPDTSGKPRIATLSSLRETSQQPARDPHQQAFYAGGADGGSGQEVLGPSARRDPEQVVSEMFQSARAHGGEPIEPGSSGPRSQRGAFRGTGFRLGSDEESAETTPTNPNQPVTLGMVQAALAAAGADLPQNRRVRFDVTSEDEDDDEPEPQEMTIKFWRNGFSVDDGPLRSYDDPANEDFLRSIRHGDVPRELFALAQGRGEINLNMEDHKTEDYVPVKKPLKPFTGEGHRLGSVVPSSVASTDTSSTLPPRDIKTAETEAQEALQLNPDEPHTSIQIRLADSSRLIMRINTNQTVRRIREFLCRARPGTLSDSFKLLTTFPSKELTDEDQTIADAQLANGTIVQRMI